MGQVCLAILVIDLCMQSSLVNFYKSTRIMKKKQCVGSSGRLAVVKINP